MLVKMKKQVNIQTICMYRVMQKHTYKQPIKSVTEYRKFNSTTYFITLPQFIQEYILLTMKVQYYII